MARTTPVSEGRWEQAQASEAAYWEASARDTVNFTRSIAGMTEFIRWAELSSGGLPADGEHIELGIGPFGVSCLHLLAGSRSVVGVDPLPLAEVGSLGFPGPLMSFVEACRDGYSHVLAPGESTGLEEGRFSSAVLHNMLDHVRDPAGVVRESARILRPGGILLVACDAFSALGAFKHRNYTRRRHPTSLEVQAHPYRFTIGELLPLFGEGGIELAGHNQSQAGRLQRVAGRHVRVFAVGRKRA